MDRVKRDRSTIEVERQIKRRGQDENKNFYDNKYFIKSFIYQHVRSRGIMRIKNHRYYYPLSDNLIDVKNYRRRSDINKSR